MILDGFKVPRNGMGKRRYRERVIDELVARAGDQFEIDPDDLAAERLALTREGRDPAMAQARLRRGAVLAQVEKEYGIEIQQTNINHAMMEEARRRAPVEEDVISFFRSNFRAMAGLQASIIEKMIGDVVMAKAARQ